MQDYGSIVKYGAIGLGVVGALWALNKLAGIGKAAAETAGGVITGNNAITQGARTDAYQGAGVVGTLGAATDRAFGGSLSKAGEYLGGAAYDLTEKAGNWYDSVLSVFSSDKFRGK